MTDRGGRPGGAGRPPGRRAAGRGALEPREDRIAAYWTLGVTGLFALVLVLSLAGVPSRFFAAATPTAVPSVPVPSVTIPVSPSIEIIPPSVSPSVSPAP